MTDHLTFAQLSDLADGTSSPGDESRFRDHMRECEACVSHAASLSALHAATAALPPEIAPPADLWNDIRRELKPRRLVDRAPSPFLRMRHLIAAAVVIAVASSLATVLVLRGHRAQSDASPFTATADSGPPATALPAQLASDERGYAESAATLQRTLDERRASLAPTTIITVERSLRIADSAIAEAREALARDPANHALAKLFASNYERKIDLLRRAAELAPRT